MKRVAIIQQARRMEDDFVFHKACSDMEVAVKYVESYRKGVPCSWVMISNPVWQDESRKYQNTEDPGFEFYIEMVEVL